MIDKKLPINRGGRRSRRKMLRNEDTLNRQLPPPPKTRFALTSMSFDIDEDGSNSWPTLMVNCRRSRSWQVCRVVSISWLKRGKDGLRTTKVRSGMRIAYFDRRRLLRRRRRRRRCLEPVAHYGHGGCLGRSAQAHLAETPSRRCQSGWMARTLYYGLC